MAPGPRAPHAHRTGVPGALLSCWPETWEPLQTSGVAKKKAPNPQAPGGLPEDLFRGLSGGPGSFSFTHPPRGLWGPPELLGTSRPADPRASGGPTGTPGSGPEGPEGPRSAGGPALSEGPPLDRGPRAGGLGPGAPGAQPSW